MIKVVKTVAGVGSLFWNGAYHEGYLDVVIPAQVDVLVLVAQSNVAMVKATVGPRKMRQFFQLGTGNISGLAFYELLNPPAGLRRISVWQTPGYVAVLAIVMLRGVDKERLRRSGAVVGGSSNGQFAVFAPSEQGALVIGGISIDTTNVPTQYPNNTALYSGVGYQSTSVFGAAYRRATGTSTLLGWSGLQTFNRIAAVAYRAARVSRMAIAPRIGTALAQSLVSSDGARARATISGATLRLRLG